MGLGLKAKALVFLRIISSKCMECKRMHAALDAIIQRKNFARIQITIKGHPFLEPHFYENHIQTLPVAPDHDFAVNRYMPGS
jgi:dissimilatory sulfite reductase (desulfoviridin) alpha/beta subunit